MDCKQVINILADYAVGALDEQTAAQVQAHVHQCESCRRELAALQKTGELLVEAQLVEPPRELWAAIRAQLEPRKVRKPKWRTYWKPAMAMAAAATILLAVMLGGPLLHQPASPTADLAVLSDAEGTAYAETQLAAAWDQPLADKASLALALAMIEPPGVGEVTQ